MIPRIITEASITFIARGRSWVLAADHGSFTKVRDILLSDADVDADHLVRLVDVRVAVADATNGSASLTDEGLFFNGEALSPEWVEKSLAAPETMRVLTVKAGDSVRVEGDEDAPDGIYKVGGVDGADSDQTIFIESEDGFLGFVKNEVIKEVIQSAGV